MIIEFYFLFINFKTLISMGALSLGWLMLYGAVIKFRELNWVRNTPTSKIRSLAMGMVEIKGRPEKYNEEFESPFSKTRCLLYRYVIKKYVTTDDDSKWKTLETGMKISKFYVNDDTGKVLIDPEGAEIELSDKNKNTYKFSRDEEKTQEIKDFLEKRKKIFPDKQGLNLSGMAELGTAGDIRLGDIEDKIDNEDRTKYIEEYLPIESEDIYIIGKALEREDISSKENIKNIVINKDDDTPIFKITTKKEKNIISSSYKKSIMGTIVGIIFSIAGFAALLIIAGIFIGVVLSSLSILGAYLFNKRYSK